MTIEDDVEAQILALSGGGYRGLYTAKILAKLEDSIGGEPIARHFDLLAGTSIGGILALALACEIPAKKVVSVFEEHGEEIFEKRAWFGLTKSKYSPDGLKSLLEDPEFFGQKTLGDCKHAVVIPSISYSHGDPVMFKTPHTEQFTGDRSKRLVDVALATSAAPAFFPRYAIEGIQYVDGGLIANAPGLIALHEAEIFWGVDVRKIRLMAIGTMSAKQTANPKKKNREGGATDWNEGHIFPSVGMSQALFGLAISAHETLTHNMLRQRLPREHYIHIDDQPTNHAVDVIGVDKTDAQAREVLSAAAEQQAKVMVGDQRVRSCLNYQAKLRILVD